MIVWRGDQPLADRYTIAQLYGVSVRTVRRHCAVLEYDAATGTALYDVLTAEEHLVGVYPRDRLPGVMQRLKESRG